MSNPYIPFKDRKSLHIAKPKPVPQPKQHKPIQKSMAIMDGFDKAAFVRKRGPFCECGCGEHGDDAHHCLIGRMKDHPELNVDENLVLVNHFEHVSLRKFNTLEWRKKFYLMQCERFGATHMAAWIASLSTKLQHRVDFLP